MGEFSDETEDPSKWVKDFDDKNWRKNIFNVNVTFKRVMVLSLGAVHNKIRTQEKKC